MTTRTLRRLGATATMALALGASAAVAPAPAQAATYSLHGTYTTPLTSGTISFQPLRAFSGGVEGRFIVGGTAHPGSTYRATGGGVGLAWYYGYTGLTAGNALVTLQPDGTYSGSVLFFNRKGAVTDSGSMTVTFP